MKSSICSAVVLVVLVGFGVTAAAAPRVLHQGVWTTLGYEIEGSWQIVEEGGRAWVVLGDDFATKSAPDLKIFLSPLALGELKNSNATAGALLVAPLVSHRGAQRLEIPVGTDLGRYKTLVLHCEKYTKLWGGAALR